MTDFRCPLDGMCCHDEVMHAKWCAVIAEWPEKDPDPGPFFG